MNRVRDVILGVYRSQLKKFKSLCVYDDEGRFLFGKKTEFGTKVTPEIIAITEKRLMELAGEKYKMLEAESENKSNEQTDP